MKKNSNATVLRIYISSTDKDGHQPLYESLVFKAREAGLAGSTVTKGILGFGTSSVIHSYKFWEVSQKVPLVVEMVDKEEKIETFYESIRQLLEDMRYGCMVVCEKVDVLLAKPGEKKNS